MAKELRITIAVPLPVDDIKAAEMIVGTRTNLSDIAAECGLHGGTVSYQVVARRIKPADADSGPNPEPEPAEATASSYAEELV